MGSVFPNMNYKTCQQSISIHDLMIVHDENLSQCLYLISYRFAIKFHPGVLGRQEVVNIIWDVVRVIKKRFNKLSISAIAHCFELVLDMVPPFDLEMKYLNYREIVSALHKYKNTQAKRVLANSNPDKHMSLSGKMGVLHNILTDEQRSELQQTINRLDANNEEAMRKRNPYQRAEGYCDSIEQYAEKIGKSVEEAKLELMERWTKEYAAMHEAIKKEINLEQYLQHRMNYITLSIND